ncbi:MAG: DUF192 domain-containing protein [Desulfomonilaceae bacterium]
MHAPSLLSLGIWLWVCLLIVPTEMRLLEGHSVAAETASPESPSQDLRSLAMTLGNKTILTKVADNDSSRIQGLLGWTNINDETGMLLDFIFEGNYAIHMQGMKFPIDAIWIDSKGAIRLIYDDIEPNSGQVYPSMFPCRYCLEVKAGFCKKFGVKIGQNVSFGG